MPQASLLPATIWLEAWGQDAGMPSVLGYIKNLRRLSSLFTLAFLP